MSDFISREQAIEEVKGLANAEYAESMEIDINSDEYIGMCKMRSWVLDVLKSVIPPVDEPHRTGKWLYTGIQGRFLTCKCSECGSHENADWAMMQCRANYCPNCGAKMEISAEWII